VSNALNAHLAHRTTERKTVTLRLEREQASSVFVIEDNGPGTPAAMRDRLFESFITGKSCGFGLGLVVAKNIVISSGGTITIKTPLGLDGGTRVIPPECRRMN
jgi:C4-dicarboxylate-specific signal transduction histidine kinase